jgi:hypothetical protein
MRRGSADQWQPHPPPQHPPPPMGAADDSPDARAPIFTPTTDSRRLTRSLWHEGHATAVGAWTSFSNSAPQARHPYS